MKEIQPNTWYYLHDGVRFVRVKTQEGMVKRDGAYYWPVRAQIGFPRTILTHPHWLVEDPEDPDAPVYTERDRIRDWVSTPWDAGASEPAPKGEVVPFSKETDQ
jgi:hypothetical protein